MGEANFYYFTCLNSVSVVNKKNSECLLLKIFASVGGGGAWKMQVEALGAESQLLFHGCEVSWVLQDHDGIQSRTDGRSVRRLLHSLVPTDRRKSQIDGRMFIQKEGSLNQLTPGSTARKNGVRGVKKDANFAGPFAF